jgi:hypothetical protein
VFIWFYSHGALIDPLLSSPSLTSFQRPDIKITERNLHYPTLNMLKIEYVILLTDGQIERYVELGYEVKGIGRGHIQHIEERVRNRRKCGKPGRGFFKASSGRLV